MKFTIVDFQDKDSWHEWRKGGIGSSDASIIMGVSRFKTEEQLKLEKATGVKLEDSSSSYIKERGNNVELFVRQAIEKLHSTTYNVANCINSAFTFMRASLDGITPDHDTITEIKLLTVFNPEKPNYSTPGYKKWLAAREQRVVPEEYLPQIMHQLMVTGASRCLFVGFKENKGLSWNADDLAIVEVLPNKEYLRDLARKEFEFWWEVNQIKNGVSEIPGNI